MRVTTWVLDEYTDKKLDELANTMQRSRSAVLRQLVALAKVKPMTRAGLVLEGQERDD
jgi:predicted transcriptional regulator